MKSNYIMAVTLDKRNQDAPKFQEIITKHGCVIRTRLGIHEVEGCTDNGLIILQLYGEDSAISQLAGDIDELPSAKATTMKVEMK